MVNGFPIRACAIASLVALLVAAASGAATSSTIVSATVPSATWIDAAACQPGTPATELGAVLPGSSAVTGATCDVEFGSSNDTSMLRMSQADRAGAAMHRLTQGEPDTGFGGTGIVSTSPLNTVRAVLADDQGRVYVGGARNGEMAVARYRDDGTLDPGWGVGGVREIPIPGAPINCADHVRGMAFDSGGRLVVVGEVLGWYMFGVWQCSNSAPADHNQYAAIARLTTGGGIDSSFSGDGVHLVAGKFRGSGVGTRFEDVIVVDGDAIVAVGAYKASGQGDVGLVARFAEDGSVAQQRTFDIGDGSALGDDRFVALDRQPDGQVLAVGGYYHSGAMTTIPIIRRMDPTSLADDTSYGPSGQRSPAAPAGGTAVDVSVLPSTSVLLLVQTGGTMHLSQLTAAGGTDNALGGDGNVSFADAGGNPSELVVQPDGSILVASTTTASGGDEDWLLRRVTAAGLLDSRFDQDGARIYEPSGASDRLYAIAEGPDGLVVAAGSLNGAGGVLRLDTTTIADYASPGTDWDAGVNVFAACLEGVTNASATWSATGTCGATDADPWYAIEADVGGAGAKVASATSGVEDAVVHLRFGMRAGTSQPPGAYLAPITFTTVAPDA